MTSIAVNTETRPLIGAAVAHRFVQDGYAVALFARTDEYIEELAADLQADGHTALAVPVDITDPDGVSSVFERVNEELGPTEVLIHNANSTFGGDIDDCSPEAFERV